MASRSKPPRKTTAKTAGRSARSAKPEAQPAPTPTRSEDEVLRALSAVSPEELYQVEKRRRAAARATPGDERLAAAKREFEAMLAAEAGTPRGGRPRKKPAVEKPADEIDLDDVPAPDASEDDA